MHFSIYHYMTISLVLYYFMYITVIIIIIIIFKLPLIALIPNITSCVENMLRVCVRYLSVRRKGK